MKINTTSDGKYVFFCPGCGCGHWFKTSGPGPVWTFNGDMEKPTVRASILVRSKRYLSGGRFPSEEEERKILVGEGVVMKDFICHSFVTDGNIQFLGDCSHELAGKTVPMEDF